MVTLLEKVTSDLWSWVFKKHFGDFWQTMERREMETFFVLLEVFRCRHFCLRRRQM